MTPLRVVLADDHPLVREGMAAVLATDPGMLLVGTAASGTEVVDVVRAQRPDVVVMDLTMPDGGGVEATRRICAEAPSVAVLILTMHEDDASLLAALRAGARGYLLKGAEGADILSALRAVARGEAVFGAGVAPRVMEVLRTGGLGSVAFPDLTPREREVLDLVARGLDNLAIGRRLGLSAKTVSNHVSAVLAKLGLSTRSQAIVRAREAGLGGR